MRATSFSISTLLGCLVKRPSSLGFAGGALAGAAAKHEELPVLAHARAGPRGVLLTGVARCGRHRRERCGPAGTRNVPASPHRSAAQGAEQASPARAPSVVVAVVVIVLVMAVSDLDAVQANRCSRRYVLVRIQP
jgi:hypothetical protein